MRKSLNRVPRLHHLQPAKGIRVSGGSVLSGFDSLLQKQPALHVLPAPRIAAIVPGVQPPLGIEIELEDITASLRKNLVLLRLRLVPPHHAALLVDARKIRRIDPGPHDPARRRAPLRAVQPPVRSPHQTVRHRMRVLQPESRQPHLRIPVGDIVIVLIRIKQQVRRVHHPDAAVASQHRVRHVQSLEHHLVLVVHAVSIGILVHRDDVTARILVRGSRRHPIETRPVVLIPAHHFHAGRIRILPVLRHPHSPALIKADVRRLRHQRLT